MKRLFVFDLDNPRGVVEKTAWTSFALCAGLPVVTAVAVLGLTNVGWLEPGTWPVFFAFVPAFLSWLIAGLLLTAPVVVGLFIAFRLPAPTPLAERNLLFASAGWVVRVFWGTAMLVAGGIIGGFIAQGLDSLAELARRALAPVEGLRLSEEAAAVLAAFVDIVFFWVGLAVALALLAAGIAVVALSIRVLHAGRESRLKALTPRAEPPSEASARRLAWREHFSHWGYGAYLLAYLMFFGLLVAWAVILPLFFAHEAVNDLIQSLVV